MDTVMDKILSINKAIQAFYYRDCHSNSAYETWKSDKIKIFKSENAAVPIVLDSLESAPESAVREIKQRIGSMNFALYESNYQPETAQDTAVSLKKFASNFGLTTHETHRSMSDVGVVELTTSSDEGKLGYIPYTSRPLNWHTDGYYNDGGSPVLAFVLHCHVPAFEGGVNKLVDPEMAYIRMRDENPAFVEAFFHPEAMVIPANVEKDGSVRPPSIGPVFFTDKLSGRLQMRYTARSRSIEWRDDPATQEAASWMKDWLASETEYVFTHRLKAGQGVLSNNVLHNRTGFVDDPDGNNQRMMMRMRFHNRISEE